MPPYPEDEEEGMPERKLLSPAQTMDRMSTDSPTAAQEVNFETLRPISDGEIAIRNRQAEQAAADAEREQARAAREAEAEAERQARTERAVQTKREKEQGIKHTVNDENQAVPVTREDGSTVYEPGWVGGPRFDENTKAWVRDNRDEYGKIVPVDMWDNRDLPRDDETGDLYFEENGIRKVVAKDEDFLRRKAIKQEIDTLARQQEESDQEIDRATLALKPLESTYAEKKKIHEEAREQLMKWTAIGAKNPGWAKNNEETLRGATEVYEASKKEYSPLEQQFSAVEKRKAELEAAKLTSRERRLSLYRERDTIEAARRRPEFAAPTPAQPGEVPEATENRETHGVGGDAYVIPSRTVEEINFRSRMKALDGEAERLSGPSLGPDPAREAKLADINATRREEIKAWSGKATALQRYNEEESALSIAQAQSEGRSRGKQHIFQKQIAESEAKLARGEITPEQHQSALAGMEKAIGQESALQADLSAKRGDLKKRTFRALQSPAEFPETLIQNGDLDFLAVETRAAGRAAAFGTGMVHELYESLLEIKDTGKVKTVGGVSIDTAIRETGALRGLKVEDILSPEDADTLHQGLRGTAFPHQKDLLHGKTIAKPYGEIDTSGTLTDSLNAARFTPAERKEVDRTLPFQKEILTKRDEIRNRAPELPEEWEAMSPAQRKKFTDTFIASRNKELEAFDQKQIASGGDRAAFVNQLRGEKEAGFGTALVDELAGRARAFVLSPYAGVQNVTMGLVDTLSLLESKATGVAPEETTLRQFAEGARNQTSEWMGQYSDSLLAQVGQGVGSSLAFVPAGVFGGLGAVAGLGAASAFGSGYFEAKDRAEAAGKPMDDVQAYLNALLSAGLGATEGLPIANALKRLDTATGGAFKRIVSVLREAGEEGAQELFQSAYQDYAYKLQGLDDRTWEEIRGDALKGAALAAFSGLLMGVGMNYAAERVETKQRNRTQAAFGVLDREFQSLSEAVRSPEALTAYNAGKPKSLTMPAAIDLLKMVETARNDTALNLLVSDDKLLNSAITAVDPKIDRAKLAETIVSRPGVLPEAVAMGREFGPLLRTGPKGPAGPLLDAVTGHVVISRLQTVLENGSIAPELGQALEREGFLIQKPTATGTRWVVTGPALSLMDGDVRRRVAKDPGSFSYAPEADTPKPGQLTADFKQTGDAAISRTLNPAKASATSAPAPASVTTPPQTPPPSNQSNPVSSSETTQKQSAGPGEFSVVLESAPDTEGFTRRRRIKFKAASIAEARTAAEAKAKAWGTGWTIQEIIPDAPAPAAYNEGDGTQPPNVESTTSDPVGESGGSGAQATGSLSQDAASQGSQQTGGGSQISDGRDDAGGNQGTGEFVSPAKAPLASDTGNDSASQSVDSGGEISPWLLRAPGLKLATRVLEKNEVVVTNTDSPTAVKPSEDGSITLNVQISDLHLGDVEFAAVLNEELKHTAQLIGQRRQWKADVKSGKTTDGFATWVVKDTKAIWNELLDRVGSLEGTEKTEVTKAIVAAFNLYYSEFTANGEAAKTLADVERFLRAETRMPSEVIANTHGFVSELGRMLAQLRETGAITEQTHQNFVEAIIDWLRRALRELRSLATSIDSDLGPLAGTQFQRLVQEIEAEVSMLEGQMSTAEYQEFVDASDVALTEVLQANSQGPELLTVLVRAGKLPARKSKYWKAWAGELSRLQDAVKAQGKGNYKGRSGMLISDLFSNAAPAPDTLVETFRENGFTNLEGGRLETIDELFQLIERRLVSGEDMHGYRDGSLQSRPRQKTPDTAPSLAYGPANDPITGSSTFLDGIDFQPAKDADLGGSESRAIAGVRAYLEATGELEAGGLVGLNHPGLLRDNGGTGTGTSGGSLLAAVSTALRSAFGKRVVFVEGIKEGGSQGVFYPPEQEVLIINARAESPLLFLVGHEFGHSLKAGNPALYAELKTLILSKAGDLTAYKKARAKKYTPDKFEDEFVNDFIGTQFIEKGFWQAMADRDAGFFRRVAMAALGYIDGLMAKVRPFSRDVRGLMADLEAARAGLVDILDRYAREGNVGAVGTWSPISDVEMMVDSKDYLTASGVPRSLLQEAQDGISRTLQSTAPGRLGEDGSYAQGDLFGSQGAGGFGPAFVAPAQKAARSLRTKKTPANPKDSVSQDLIDGLQGDWAALARELDAKGRASSIYADLVSRRIPDWDIAGTVISSPEDVLAVMQPIRSPYFESLKVIVLDGNNMAVTSQILHVGSLNESIADPKAIFAPLVRLREQTGKEYRRIVLSHNHPSGDPSPSDADRNIQRRLEILASLAGFGVVDHVITNGETFFSFREAGESGNDTSPPGKKEYAPRKNKGTFAQKQPSQSDWEVVKRSGLMPMDYKERVAELAKFIRNNNPDSAHILYLNTKLKMLGVERISLETLKNQREIARTVLAGAAREGAYAFILEMPVATFDVTRPIMDGLRRFSAAANIGFIDFILTNENPAAGESSVISQRDLGLMETPTIDTTGEGNLFPENDLPFNLQGEIDTTPIRQAQVERKQAEAEAKRRLEVGQGMLFARPRNPAGQLGFDFALQHSEAFQGGLPFTEVPVPPTQSGFQFDDPLSQMGQSPADPAPVVEMAAPEPVQPETKISDFGEKIGGARKDTAKPLGPRAKTADPEDDRPGWMRKYIPAKKLETLRGSYNAKTGRYERETRETGKWVVLRKDNVSVRSPEFDSEADAEAAIPFIEYSRNHGISKMRDREEWAIYRRIGERKRPIVRRGFPTEEAAMEYVAQNTAEVIEYKFPFPQRPWLDRLERVGGRERSGDVTPQMFQESFGFRAGEFGNWNMGGDGQAALNFAFDALNDLAEILGVSPRALSLNGELAIAFGARGTGGKNSGSAHYEPDYRVINLTKIKGAGSLAHEWFHALDHYLGKTSFSPMGFASDGFVAQAREELKTAFEAVTRSLVARKEERAVSGDVAQKNLERQTQWLRESLKQVRDNFDRAHTWVKGKKPPTADQSARFDAIALKIASLDVGAKVYIPGKTRMSIGRGTFPEIEELNAVYKEVTGRSFATAQEHSQGRTMYWQIDGAQKALARVKDAAEGAKEIKTVATDFLIEARKIDESRVESYYSKPIEMGARSFESFVADKLAASERRNDYLVSGTDNRLYALLDMKPYPEGNERIAMNGAWQNLWNVIQERTVEGRTALYARPRKEEAFYSRLEQVIGQKIQGRAATPEQVKAIIDPAKGSGIKAEEIKWSGILQAIDRLAGENDGKVPKDALLEYLRNEGAVRFEEVVAENETVFSTPQDIEDYGSEAKTYTKEDAVEFLQAEAEKIREAYRDQVRSPEPVDEDGDETTVDNEDYPIVGWKIRLTDGSNLTFPTESEAQKRFDDEVEWIEIESAIVDTEDLRLSTHEETIITMESNGKSTNGNIRYGKYQLPGGRNYREVVLSMPSRDRSGNAEGRSPEEQAEYERDLANLGEYRSSHFPDIPNYVAHMRLNEREDSENNRVLHSEEYQSDRHQEGKKKGYREDTKEFYLENSKGETAGPYLSRESAEFSNDGTYTVKERPIVAGVPDAPFRKDWPLALFKRQLRDAVEGGFDGVTWTTGETQAERYDLSKQVEYVKWETRSINGRDSGKTVVIPILNTDQHFHFTIDDKGFVKMSGLSGRGSESIGKPLSDVIGKEIAEKVISERSGKLEGDGLKVGGSGMKGFYDQILPKEIGKYVKQWGGTVEKAAILHEPDDATLSDPEAPERIALNDFGEMETPVWRVLITPQMRESVRTQGQTLFARPRSPQEYFPFAVEVTQRDQFSLPLTVQDGMRGATPTEDNLFMGNTGLAFKIAGGYANLGDIDDVKQEALIALTRAARTFDPAKGKFSTWAGAVIRNHLNGVYRSRDKIQADSLDAEVNDGQALADITGDGQQSPAVTTQRREALTALQSVIATLPEDLQGVIRARLAGQTQEQIGKGRGLKKQTISNMEKVAMNMLRVRLKAQGVDGIPLQARPRKDKNQGDFLNKIDKQLFPNLYKVEKAPPGMKALTPAEISAVAGEYMREAKNVADGIEAGPTEEALPEERKRSLREIYTRFFRGRFDKLDYFAPGAGQLLLDDLRTNANFGAAMRRFNKSLEDKIRSSFGYPSWWRNADQQSRMKRFRAEILPYAAALNPVNRDGAGDLVFESFWQRAGELSGAQVQNMNRQPGEQWIDERTSERWRITGFVAPDPAKPQEGFYQLERFIPAESQEMIHGHFHSMYPEAAFLLDDFIEPGMEAERVVSPQGVELPAFNRHSLYGFYGDTPAGLVDKIEGYTPDVARTRSLAGMAASMLRLDWQSPGRDYKSGQARVSGQVRDLFEGFNIRAAQAHMETQRRDMAEKLLKATMLPVPDSGVPADYRRLDRDTLNPLIRAMRYTSRKGQADMPEIMATATDQLTQKNLETLRFLFGDPALFDPMQMISKDVFAELERGFVKTKTDHDFLDAILGWVRSSVAGVLADFQTFSINKISNYIFHTMLAMQRTAYAAYSAAAGEKMEARQAIREAGFLMKGFFTNFYDPAIKDRVDRMVPPEMFEDQNIIRQIMAENAELSVTDLLRQGNVGGAFLKGVGYGEMDVKAKQKIALASLLARASMAADEAGISGTGRKAWMQQWVENAPVEARRESELGAKLYLMDYANVPFWLDQGHKIVVDGHDITPYVNAIRALAIPFWKYPFNYLRQMKRLGVDSIRTGFDRTATGKAQREAAANLTAMAMVMTAFWLISKPWGDDDDEILGRDVDDAGKKLDPKIRTSSRIRLAESSLIGGAVGTAARLFGAEPTDDLWVRVRTLPYATQSMALGAALRWMLNPSEGGSKEAMSSAWDMVEDFMSIGSGARIGLTFMGYRDDYTDDQEASFTIAAGTFDLLTARVLPPRALKDIANLIDPVNRRYVPADSLDYYPGAGEAIISKIPGLTTILPPSGKLKTVNADSPKAKEALVELTALGVDHLAYKESIDEKTGKLKATFVNPKLVYKHPSWKAMVRQFGFNLKPVDRQQYQEALAAGEE